MALNTCSGWNETYIIRNSDKKAESYSLLNGSHLLNVNMKRNETLNLNF